MMTVAVDTTSTSPKGLVLGATLRYSDDGPIRFLMIVVPWEVFSHETRVVLTERLNKWQDEVLEDDPLF